MPAAEGMSGIWMDISGDMPGDHAEAMILKKKKPSKYWKASFCLPCCIDYLTVMIQLKVFV